MTETYYRAQTADRDPVDLIGTDNISFSWYGPQSYDREGVSVCASRDALAYYLANSALPIGIGEWVIVELEGDRIWDADPMDAELGELLVHPTAVVSVTPMDDEFFDLIGAVLDQMESE